MLQRAFWRRGVASLIAGLALAGCAGPNQPVVRPNDTAQPTAEVQPSAQAQSTVEVQPARQPSFRAAPAEGRAGDQIQIDGWGYTPGSEVSVRFGVPQPAGDVLARARVNNGGEVHISLTLPDSLPVDGPVPAADMLLVVSDAATGQQLASGPFSYISSGGPGNEQAVQVVGAFLQNADNAAAARYLSSALLARRGPDQPLPELAGLPSQGWDSFTVGVLLERPSDALFVPATLSTAVGPSEYLFTLVLEGNEWKINSAEWQRSDSPGQPGAEYRELLRADATGDGLGEIYFGRTTDIQAQASFGDAYLDAHAETVGSLLVAQEGAHGLFPWLSANRFGVYADAQRLSSFGSGEPPAAFMVAFDPGSSYLISLLPLKADGTQHSQPLHINWYADRHAFALAPVGPSGEYAEPAAQAPDQQAALNIGTVARDYLRQQFPDRPIIAGALAVAGDYAVASAVPAGMEWRTLFLHVAPGAGYEVIYDNIAVTSEELLARGIPASLLQPSDVAGVVGAVIANTNNPTYGGAEASVTVEGIDAGFARATMHQAAGDTITVYTRFNGATWEWLTQGQTFSPAELDEFAIPASLR